MMKNLTVVLTIMGTLCLAPKAFAEKVTVLNCLYSKIEPPVVVLSEWLKQQKVTGVEIKGEESMSFAKEILKGNQGLLNQYNLTTAAVISAPKILRIEGQEGSGFKSMCVLFEGDLVRRLNNVDLSPLYPPLHSMDK